VLGGGVVGVFGFGCVFLEFSNDKSRPLEYYWWVGGWGGGGGGGGGGHCS